MGIFSKFEGRMEDTFEGAASKMFDSPISPVQIAKKAEKKMRREKIVGAGKQYAPTLYTVLVNADDDQRLFGYYPTLAGETETYLAAKAVEEGLTMDGQPLVRFIVDDSLKRGKFDIIAELVASPIISQLRAEEMDRYGIGSGQQKRGGSPQTPPPQQQGYAPQAPPSRQQGYADQRDNQPRQAPGRVSAQQAPYSQSAYDQGYSDYPYGNEIGQQDQQDKPPLPYVPEDELDYSIDYGEYTFNSQDFEDYRQNGASVSSDDGYYDGNRRISEPLADPAAAAMGGIATGMAEQAADAVSPPQGSVDVPNTVVFAPGPGNARPIPNSSMVRASLLNATDNRTYDLATTRLLLGRESKNGIVVDDINASRTHAEIRYEPQGAWIITDLGSTNGTLVNGREITSHTLQDGDYITIGMTNFVFIQA